MIKKLKLVTSGGNTLDLSNSSYMLGVEIIACSMSANELKAAIAKLQEKLAAQEQTTK